ncbi:MAG TPA: nitroreductase family protein, partial [Oligoflexia bacterium]|nr:nitroreductase family protein [Oligoflexia bacterium]
TDFRKVMVGDLVNSRTDSEVKIWAAKQTYIVMGMLLMAAAELSIDACPMEGIEPAKYDEILGLAGSGFSTVSAVALGYRHAEDIFGKMKKVRKSRDELFVSL